MLKFCNPTRITKADKKYAKKLDCKAIKFLVKIRDIHKTEQKNSISISGFGMKIKKNIQSIKICFEEKHVDLLLTEAEGKKQNFLIKDFNTFNNVFVVIVHRLLVQQKD